MKKYVIWALLVLSFMVGGCRQRQDPFVKKVIIGYYAEPDASIQWEGMDMEIDPTLLHKKIYMGVVDARNNLRRYVTASYEKEGKTYRYDEPLLWTTDRDDIIKGGPMPWPFEYLVSPRGDALGKTIVTAAAATQEGTPNVDSAEVYVVPQIRDYMGAITPIGLVFDKEEWMKYPENPGFGAKRIHTSPEADVIFRSEGIYFPYGCTPLPEIHCGDNLFFDWIDWDTEITPEPVTIPYLHTWWYLCYDKHGRKIGVYSVASKRSPLTQLVWHAYEDE